MSAKLNNQATLLRLQKSVSFANGVEDLVPILRTLALDDLKQYIQHKLKSLDMSALAYSYYNASNIEQILGDDVMQHMLSFTGLYHAKGVSKSWKQYCDKNEALQILRIHQLNLSFPNGKKVRNTWLVHKHRTTLHPKEIELGYKSPLSSLLCAMGEAESGDRILIHKGEYELKGNKTPYRKNSLEIVKNLMIIGVEDDVTLWRHESIEDDFPEYGMSIWCYADVYFENMKIEFMSIYHEGSISNDAEGALWMNRVRHTGWRDTAAISMVGDASLRLTDCEFDGHKTAIEISIGAKDIHVERCLFRGMNHSCIEIYHRYDFDTVPPVSFKCIGNVFQDNYGYTTSFVCKHDTDGNHNDSDLYTVEFRDNLLKGFNGKALDIDIDDANKLYRI
eukprot:365507_1